MDDIAERVIRLETRMDAVQTETRDVRDMVKGIDSKVDTLLQRDARQAGAADVRRAMFGGASLAAWSAVAAAVSGGAVYLLHALGGFHG